MGNNRKVISNKNLFHIHKETTRGTRVCCWARLVGFVEIHIKGSQLYLYCLQTPEKITHELADDNVPKDKPQKNKK